MQKLTIEPVLNVKLKEHKQVHPSHKTVTVIGISVQLG